MQNLIYYLMHAILIVCQLNAESHFHNDLGLDSLDTVEVVMAIEEVSLHEMFMVWRG